MRILLECGLLALWLSGCVYDYEGAKARALQTAKEECEHDGRRFVLLKDSVNLDRKDVTVKGACLKPGEELPADLQK